jgi:hypothetical protein
MRDTQVNARITASQVRHADRSRALAHGGFAFGALAHA